MTNVSNAESTGSIPGQKTRIPHAKKKQGGTQSLQGDTKALSLCTNKWKKCDRVRAEEEFGLGPLNFGEMSRKE